MAGVAHFGAAYAEYTRTGGWNAVSNNAGISFSATITTDFGYNNSKDAANGVAQNGSIVKPKTVDVKEDDFNQYGAINASMGILGGIIEIGVGGVGEGVTAGFSTALVVDGWYRVGSNGARLGMYLANENLAGDIIPSNSGALAGKIIDGMNGTKATDVGRMQSSMGFANDLGLFVITGGNGSAYLDANAYRDLYHIGIIGGNWYTIYDYKNTAKEYKHNKSKKK
ncbi:hypothetical protein OIU83_11685 [Flavobacterium sp. LS1R49]|uniref:Uncharacterized protein n=1 Tax=Flavobacterium shii TaxID=2987687 RepID=A0A9X2ZGR6_9FLAO|nr:hypothetical protein [Flavobacterium shii]MCV9928322.1 hypothetical protein [Flavobacterium shii]